MNESPAAKEAGVTASLAAAHEGILLLDKPAGVSSFQALRPLKRLFPKTKIGHAGTLDPAATGLLLVGIGAGTRLLEYLEGMPKTYSFTARFGLVSDSYDMEGAVEPHPSAASAGTLDADRIGSALSAFRGPIRQTPPAYSAIKIDGERACDRMRAGGTVTLDSREVTVHSLDLRSFAPAGPSPADASAMDRSVPSAEMVMTCSKGTYVRSLVHDLGESLGCGAVTDNIRRLAIGPFRVEDAVRTEDLVPGVPLRPLEAAVAHLPSAVIPASHVARFLNGQFVAPAGAETAVAADPARSGDSTRPSPEPQEYRALDQAGRLLAIATFSPLGLLCPRKVLAKA
ncbi:MAG: truB [Fibrobacteres bacterium]|nr:truB [Fibrobacterota bacterium]